MSNNRILAILLSTVILTSCGTSHDVVDGGLFQKRKYNKGYHISKKTKFESPQFSQEDEITIASENNDLKSNDNDLQTKNNSETEFVGVELANDKVLKIEEQISDHSNTESTNDSHKLTKSNKLSGTSPVKRLKSKNVANDIINQFNFGEIASSSNTSSDGSIMNIILAIILIVAIIMVLSFLDGLLGGLLGLVLLIIIIVLLLRYFGII